MLILFCKLKSPLTMLRDKVIGICYTDLVKFYIYFFIRFLYISWGFIQICKKQATAPSKLICC